MDDQSNSQSATSGLKRTLALSASALSDALGDWATGADPLNEQLATAVARAIEMGELTAGTRLPAERELARALGLSRTTIVAAYDRLRESGLVRSRQGSGTRVAARRPGLTQAYPSPADTDRAWSGRSPTMTAHADRPIGLLTPVIDDAVELTIGALPAGPGVASAIADAVREDVPRLLERDGYDPFGLPALRDEIAAHLRGRGAPTDPDQVLITSGAQQALYLIGSQLGGDGASVALENPTYIGAIDAFRATGNRLIPVPIDGNGARVEVIRLLAAGGPIRFAYIIPTFQNPTGSIMPEARRRDIVRLADEVGFQIVEDLTPDLTLDAPPPLAAFDPDGRIVTVGSLSKLAWGGLRIGYIRASRVDIDRLVAGKIVADHSTSLVTQAIATRVFRDIDSIARATRTAAEQRRDLLTDALGQRIPEWTWSDAQGGFSLWVRLPNADGTSFARLAAGHGVIVRPGPLASPDGGFRDHIRIAFGTAPDRLVEGVERLASAWAAYTPTARSIRSSIAVSV